MKNHFVRFLTPLSNAVFFKTTSHSEVVSNPDRTSETSLKQIKTRLKTTLRSINSESKQNEYVYDKLTKSSQFNINIEELRVANALSIQLFFYSDSEAIITDAARHDAKLFLKHRGNSYYYGWRIPFYTDTTDQRRTFDDDAFEQINHLLLSGDMLYNKATLCDTLSPLTHDHKCQHLLDAIESSLEDRYLVWPTVDMDLRLAMDDIKGKLTEILSDRSKKGSFNLCGMSFTKKVIQQTLKEIKLLETCLDRDSHEHTLYDELHQLKRNVITNGFDNPTLINGYRKQLDLLKQRQAQLKDEFRSRLKALHRYEEILLSLEQIEESAAESVAMTRMSMAMSVFSKQRSEHSDNLVIAEFEQLLTVLRAESHDQIPSYIDKQPSEFWYQLICSLNHTKSVSKSTWSLKIRTRELCDHLSKQRLHKEPFLTQRVPHYISHGRHREKFGQTSELESLKKQFSTNIERMNAVNPICAKIMALHVNPNITDKTLDLLVKLCLRYKKTIKTNGGSHQAYLIPSILPQSFQSSDIQTVCLRLALVFDALNQLVNK